MKVKCELIPVEEYDGTPPILFEDENFSYIAGAKEGYFLRLTKKTCSLCPASALFVGIFKYKRHQRVERLCRIHASSFGTLPIQVNDKKSLSSQLTSKEKLAIPKRTNMKVKI